MNLRKFRIGGIEIIFLLYLLSNVFVAATSLFYGFLPESSPFPYFKFDLFSMLLNFGLVSFFYFFLWFLFAFFKRNLKETYRNVESEAIIGWFTFFCQSIFLYYVVKDGVFSAGLSHKIGTGFIGYFSLLLVPDSLFLVYFSFAKSPYLSVLNSCIYLISSILRGWGGGLLLIVFLKLIRGFKRENLKYIFFGLLFLSIVAPFVYQMRTTVRGRGFFDLSKSGELVEETFVKAYFPSEEEGVVGPLFQAIANRFSHLTSCVVIADNLDLFWFGVWDEKFAPAFSEGKIQQILTRKRFVGKPVLAEYLCSAMLPTPLGPWYIHPGLVGWLWVNPFLFPITFGYFVLLILIGVFLMLKLGTGARGMKAVFLFSLIYSINGWYVPFSNCLQAMIVFLLLQKICRICFANFQTYSFFEKSMVCAVSKND